MELEPKLYFIFTADVLLILLKLNLYSDIKYRNLEANTIENVIHVFIQKIYKYNLIMI